MKLLLSVLLSGSLLAVAAPAAAQITPGYTPDYDAARAQYRAFAMGQFQDVFSAWMEAVQDKDAEAAAALYTPNALLFVDGVANGGQGVEATLETWLSGFRGIRAGIQDFDVSDGMSYATVHMEVSGVNSSDDASGIMVFVLMRARGGWKIRSHTVVTP